MAMAKTMLTPTDENINVLVLQTVTNKADHKVREEFPYSSLIRTSLYLSTHSQPNITLSVRTLSRFGESSSTAHCVAAKCVLLYLQVKNLESELGSLHSDQV